MTAFLDLFSGIGGFALGAYWSGLRFDAHYFSEVDDYAIRVYQQRFPDAIPLGDITKIDGTKLPAYEWIIAGGFPCQDISVAGKGAGLEGERSGLWYEYARLIGELRPRYAIMENVGALTFRGLDAVLGSLAEIGYDAEWQDIRASDVGAPHRRERIWIVAYPSSVESGERFDLNVFGGREVETEQTRLGGRGVPYPERINGDDSGYGTSTIFRERPEEAEISGLVADTDLPRWDSGGPAESSGWAKSNPVPGCIGERRSGNAWWSTEPDVGRVAHGVPSRVDRLKCLGNSIVPQIAELIFSTSAFDEWRV